MSNPHIYDSFEIANAVHCGWGVDDHLAHTQFVKLKDYDDAVKDCMVGVMFSEEGEDNRSLRHRIDQLERDNAALVEQLRKAVEEQLLWIPCSVRLPHRGEYVFVNGSQGVEVRCWDTIDETDDYDGHDISFDAWFKENEVTGDPYYWIEFDEVKYWMPKPKDPENDKKEDNHV